MRQSEIMKRVKKYARKHGLDTALASWDSISIMDGKRYTKISLMSANGSVMTMTKNKAVHLEIVDDDIVSIETYVFNFPYPRYIGRSQVVYNEKWVDKKASWEKYKAVVNLLEKW